MGEANLVLSRHILLPGVPVRYPNLWPVSAQYAFGHGFGAAGGDLVQYGPVRYEYPLPMGHAIDAGRRLIRSDNLGFSQSRPDRRTGRLQRVGQPLERIGNGALRYLQPEKFIHNAAQPLEPDMVTMMQIQKQCVDVRPERRARRHAVRRSRTEPRAAPSAASAKKLDPRGVRRDGRQIDMIIAVTNMLALALDVLSLIHI